MFYDEELAQARVDDSTVEVRIKASPFNGFQPVPEVGNSTECAGLREEIEDLKAEQRQNQATVEELMSFCQRVSSQHDQLLAQNGKLKRLLSLVTDRLIRLDPKLIKDIDFSEVINDPCKEFAMMSGSPRESEMEVTVSVQDMPFSATAGRDVKKREAGK